MVKNVCFTKTLFLALFDPRSSIVKSVFNCRLSGVIKSNGLMFPRQFAYWIIIGCVYWTSKQKIIEEVLSHNTVKLPECARNGSVYFKIVYFSVFFARCYFRGNGEITPSFT